MSDDELFSSRRVRKAKVAVAAAQDSTDGEMSPQQRELHFATTAYTRHISELPKNDQVKTVELGELHFEWHITPEEGLWKGATYVFDVKLPNNFPYQSPIVTLKTPIWHPNIDTAGKPCVSVLQKGWLPTHMLSYVMYGLLFLFTSPNPDDPLNIKAAEEMRVDEDRFKKNIKEFLAKANQK